jgi:hypothetical protein
MRPHEVHELGTVPESLAYRSDLPTKNRKKVTENLILAGAPCCLPECSPLWTVRSRICGSCVSSLASNNCRSDSATECSKSSHRLHSRPPVSALLPISSSSCDFQISPLDWLRRRRAGRRAGVGDPPGQWECWWSIFAVAESRIDASEAGGI